MIDKHKAIFLPIDDRILNLYKGFIYNGSQLFDLKYSDVFTESKHYVYDSNLTAFEKIVKVIIIVPFLPLYLIILSLSVILKKGKYVRNKTEQIINSLFSVLFRKERKVQINRVKNRKYEKVLEENIPAFLDHCKKYYVKVFIYSYQSLTEEQNAKIENLINTENIDSCLIIKSLSDLSYIIESKNISIDNSLLVIKSAPEREEAKLAGFNLNYEHSRNVIFWGERDLYTSSVENFGEVTLLSMRSEIEFYLKAKSNAFLTNNVILFIEDKRDDYLNNYLKQNLSKINKRLSQKKMQLIYFPSFQKSGGNLTQAVQEFLRYRIPVLYSLTDQEIREFIKSIFEGVTSEEFYRLILEELQLPFFERPCLLRNIYGGLEENRKKFTYSFIGYKTKKDLDNFFDWYIKQVSIPDDSWHMVKCCAKMALPPDVYDADWNFREESKKVSDELKLKIDLIKAEGKFDVLAHAILYMLESIKDENPEILKKVKPLIEKGKLLESNVILSPLVVDKHYNILLPDFGNIEVKMHALPKTVYFFFLKYPDGIRFKELYLHRAELLDIYNKLTNKYDNEEIEKAIDDLVDITNPSINQKCARVREAFREIMDEHIAKYYYIDGFRGEPKKILLPRNLIDIRY